MGFWARLWLLLRSACQGGKPARVDIERRFKLHQRLTEGSMSECWQATDRDSGREVCVKVLDDEKLEQLIKRTHGAQRPSEGAIAVQMHHPNVVTTFEHGITTQDRPFLVMEFIHGTSLSILIDSQSRQLRKHRLKYLIQLGQALAHCHQRGFIHHDVCPRNVLIRDDHNAKLIDFGLAIPDTEPFHRPGNRTGTANYMAPELIRRQPIDCRIDVFAYGVIAYEVFTGQRPWPSTESLQAMMTHINSPPVDPREVNHSLATDIAEVLLKAIARDPEERYSTIDEVVGCLRHLRKTKRRR